MCVCGDVGAGGGENNSSTRTGGEREKRLRQASRRVEDAVGNGWGCVYKTVAVTRRMLVKRLDCAMKRLSLRGGCSRNGRIVQQNGCVVR